MHNHLVYRLVILNTCGSSALAFAWHRGFVAMVFEADSSGICFAIAALFVAGLFSVFQRAFKVTRALNAIKAGSREPMNGVKFLAKGDHIADIAQWLAVLGLTGTIVGFIQALNGINVDGDPEAIIAQLIAGMSVAFYTTLAGGVTGMWLELNNRILKTASVSMLEDAR